MDCWIQSFKAWFEQEGSAHKAFIADENGNLPADFKEWTVPYEDSDFLLQKIMEWTEITVEGSQALLSKNLMFLNDDIKFFKISAKSDEITIRAPYKFKMPFYEKWEAWAESQRTVAPDAMKSLTQTAANNVWSFMITE